MKRFHLLLVIALVAVAGAAIQFVVSFKSFPKYRIQAEKTSLAEEDIFSWIEQIVGFGPRKPASEGDEKTREFITAKFREFGLDVAEPEPLGVDTATIGQWGLWLKDSQSGEETAIPCYPLPFPAPTQDGALDAGMVYVGDGQTIEELDAAGRIVVFEQQFERHNWDIYRRLFFLYDPSRSIPKGHRPSTPLDKTERLIHDAAFSRGAVGLIGLLSGLQWESDTFCPQLNHGVRKELPGVWVGPRNAGMVREAAAGDTLSRLRAKLLIQVEQGRGETYNIWAVLPGQVDEYYLVMAHHDTPFANAVQDASGVAVMLALAKHFSRVKDELPLRRGIVFLAGGGHTLGRLGEMAFVQKHRIDLLPKIALVVSVEHIAREFAPQEDMSFACSEQPALRMFFTSGSRKVSGIVQSSILQSDYRRSIIMPQWVVKRMTGKARGISGEFYEAGLPVVGLLSNPPYMFFQEDTVATVAREELVPTTDLIISILRTADELPISELRN